MTLQQMNHQTIIRTKWIIAQMRRILFYRMVLLRGESDRYVWVDCYILGVVKMMILVSRISIVIHLCFCLMTKKRVWKNIIRSKKTEKFHLLKPKQDWVVKFIIHGFSISIKYKPTVNCEENLQICILK